MSCTRVNDCAVITVRETVRIVRVLFIFRIVYDISSLCTVFADCEKVCRARELVSSKLASPFGFWPGIKFVPVELRGSRYAESESKRILPIIRGK